jgi:hypothetical protein
MSRSSFLVHARIGTHVDRKKGTPQGGVVSLRLATFFLRSAFDSWMHQGDPCSPLERDADVMAVHPRSLRESERIESESETFYAGWDESPATRCGYLFIGRRAFSLSASHPRTCKRFCPSYGGVRPRAADNGRPELVVEDGGCKNRVWARHRLFWIAILRPLHVYYAKCRGEQKAETLRFIAGAFGIE